MWHLFFFLKNGYHYTAILDPRWIFSILPWIIRSCICHLFFSFVYIWHTSSETHVDGYKSLKPINMQSLLRPRFICIFLIISTLKIIGLVDCEGGQLPKNSATFDPRSGESVFGESGRRSGRIAADSETRVPLKDAGAKDKAPRRLPRFTQSHVLDTLGLAGDGSSGLLGMYNLTDYPFLCLNTSRIPRGRDFFKILYTSTSSMLKY